MSGQNVASSPGRHYRFYDLVMAAFVTVLLCSNLIGPGKVCAVTLPLWGSLSFGAGNIFFPFSYIFGDILTEVYGYARSRKVIWAGFGAVLFASIMSYVIIHLPVDKGEKWNETFQPALEVVFGGTFRIVIASIIAFWVGDFANAFVLAKMKVVTAGKHLWARTIGSTIVGQGLDSLIFYPVAFYGIWETKTLLSVVLFNWVFKVVIEALMTPFTYAITGFLKKVEKEDFYDTTTNFTPFSLKD